MGCLGNKACREIEGKNNGVRGLGAESIDINIEDKKSDYTKVEQGLQEQNQIDIINIEEEQNQKDNNGTYDKKLILEVNKEKNDEPKQIILQEEKIDKKEDNEKINNKNLGASQIINNHIIAIVTTNVPKSHM